MTTSLEEADNSQTHEEYPTATIMEDGDVVIVGGARTPLRVARGKERDGGKGGRLSSISAEELGPIAIKGALEKLVERLKRSRSHGTRSSDSSRLFWCS